MWRKQAARIRALRLAAMPHSRDPATILDKVRLEVIVFATPTDGDLDGFVAGICDGLQPSHPNTPIRDEDWLDLPAPARPRTPLLLADDRAVASIAAERRAPENGREYEVYVRW